MAVDFTSKVRTSGKTINKSWLQLNASLRGNGLAKKYSGDEPPLRSDLHTDRIYVLERGGIVEFGRHAELLANKGLYYAMWRQQVGEGKARIDAPKSSLVSI